MFRMTLSGPLSTRARLRAELERHGNELAPDERTHSHGLTDHTDDETAAAAGDVEISWLELVGPDLDEVQNEARLAGWALRVHSELETLAPPSSDLVVPDLDELVNARVEEALRARGL